MSQEKQLQPRGRTAAYCSAVKSHEVFWDGEDGILAQAKHPSNAGLPL